MDCKSIQGAIITEDRPKQQRRKNWERASIPCESLAKEKAAEEISTYVKQESSGREDKDEDKDMADWIKYMPHTVICHDSGTKDQLYIE